MANHLQLNTNNDFYNLHTARAYEHMSNVTLLLLPLKKKILKLKK